MNQGVCGRDNQQDEGAYKLLDSKDVSMKIWFESLVGTKSATHGYHDDPSSRHGSRALQKTGRLFRQNPNSNYFTEDVICSAE